MNHHHRKILHAFFAHPVSANIEFRDVEHVMVMLGAEVDAKTGNRVDVALNGQTTVLHRNHDTLTKVDVLHIRKFLEGCGISPEAFPV